MLELAGGERGEEGEARVQSHKIAVPTALDRTARGYGGNGGTSCWTDTADSTKQTTTQTQLAGETLDTAFRRSFLLPYGVRLAGEGRGLRQCGTRKITFLLDFETLLSCQHVL